MFDRIELDTQLKLKLFGSLVGSILNNGAEIIVNTQSHDTEKVLGVRKSTNLDAIYGDLGRYPMKVHWKIEAIIYWIKILKLNNNSLMERMYNVIKEDANKNISYVDKNWAYQIKKLLGELGLMNLWKNQDTYNITFGTIKLRILYIFRQSWYSNINNVFPPTLYTSMTSNSKNI